MIPALRPLPENALEETWRDARRRLALMLPDIPPLGLATALRGDLGALYRQVAAQNLRALRALPDSDDPPPILPETDPRFWPGLLARLLHGWPHRCLPDIAALDHCPPPLLEPVIRALLDTGLSLDTDDAETARREGWFVDLVRWIEARILDNPQHPEARALLRGFLETSNFLAHFRMRHANHGSVSNFRVHDQQIFGLLGIDIDPAGNDHEALAVGQEEIAILVDMTNITKRTPFGV